MRSRTLTINQITSLRSVRDCVGTPLMPYAVTTLQARNIHPPRVSARLHTWSWQCCLKSDTRICTGIENLSDVLLPQGGSLCICMFVSESFAVRVLLVYNLSISCHFSIRVVATLRMVGFSLTLGRNFNVGMAWKLYGYIRITITQTVRSEGYRELRSLLVQLF